MKFRLVVPAAMLIFSTCGLAANVEYQHPDVTIVAVNESLESVLISLGKKMALSITTLSDINPLINCDIQNQPIEQAIRKLLGDLSYSLVWAEGGERLNGIVIFASEGAAAETTLPQGSSAEGNNRYSQLTPEPDAGDFSPTAAPARQFDGNEQISKREAELAIQQQEQEAHRAEVRDTREAETAAIREAQEIAHEAEMVEKRARKEAEIANFADALGLTHP